MRAHPLETETRAFVVGDEDDDSVGETSLRKAIPTSNTTDIFDMLPLLVAASRSYVGQQVYE